MRRLEFSGAVRPIYGSLGIKRLSIKTYWGGGIRPPCPQPGQVAPMTSPAANVVITFVPKHKTFSQHVGRPMAPPRLHRRKIEVYQLPCTTLPSSRSMVN